jgi:hypothetical protein
MTLWLRCEWPKKDTAFWKMQPLGRIFVRRITLSEIGQHARGSAERRLGVDNELGENAWLRERGQVAEEAEFAATEGCLQAIQKEPAEGPRQRVEVRLAGEASILSGFNMAAGRRRAAGRDRSDCAPFDAPEMSDVRSFVTLAVAAEDIGQFEGRRPSGHS